MLPNNVTFKRVITYMNKYYRIHGFADSYIKYLREKV